MNGNETWIWLVVGLVPYHISWQCLKDRRTLEVRALFWSMVVCLRRDELQWTVHVPLIERLRR